MKKKIEILKLEDRILFDAAGAVAVADAVAEVDAQQDVQSEENQDLETIISATAAPEDVVDNMTTTQEDSDADADTEVSDDTEDTIAQVADDINDDADDTEVINTIESLASELSDVEEVEFNVPEEDLTDDIEAEDSEVELATIDDTEDDVVFADILDDEVTETRELVIINSSVWDVESLTEGLSENSDVLILESGTDALDVINEYLDNSDATYSAIHFISHGNDGYFVLNGDVIDIESVAADQDSWLSIGEHLTEDADILIYGCNVASSEDGQALVASIANLTGADVAASTDFTGSTGDWDLEFSVGDIETLVISPEDYAYRFADWTAGTGENEYTLNYCFANAEDGDSITITAVYANHNQIVTVSEIKELTITVDEDLRADYVTITFTSDNVTISGDVTSSVNLVFTGNVKMDAVLTGEATDIGADEDYTPTFIFDGNVYSYYDGDIQNITLGADATFVFNDTVTIYSDQTWTVNGNATFSNIEFYGSISYDATLVGGDNSIITILNSGFNVEDVDIYDFDGNRISSTGTVVYGDGDQYIIFGEYNDLRLGEGTYTVMADDREIGEVSSLERNIFTLNGSLYGDDITSQSWTAEAETILIFEGFNYDGDGTIVREAGESTYDYKYSLLDVEYKNASNLTNAIYGGIYGNLTIAWGQENYTKVETHSVKFDNSVTVLGDFTINSTTENYIDAIEIMSSGELVLLNTIGNGIIEISKDLVVWNYGDLVIATDQITIESTIINYSGATLSFANGYFIIADTTVDTTINTTGAVVVQVENAGTIQAGYYLEYNVYGSSNYLVYYSSILDIYTSGLTETGVDTAYVTHSGYINIYVTETLNGDLGATVSGTLTVYSSQEIFEGDLYIDGYFYSYIIINGDKNTFNGTVTVNNSLIVQGEENIFNGNVFLYQGNNGTCNSITLNITDSAIKTTFNGSITVDGDASTAVRAIINVDADNTTFNGTVSNSGIINVNADNSTFTDAVSGSDGYFYIRGNNTVFKSTVTVENSSSLGLISQGEFNIVEGSSGTTFKGDIVSSTQFTIDAEITLASGVSVTASNIFNINEDTTFNGDVYVVAVSGYETIFNINADITVTGDFSNTNNSSGSASKVVIATDATATFEQGISNSSTGSGSAQFEVSGAIVINASDAVFSNSGTSAYVYWYATNNKNTFSIENSGKFFIDGTGNTFESFTNTGTLSVTNDVASVTFNTLYNEGTITIYSTTTTIGTLENSGTITLSSATTIGDITNEDGGVITFNNGVYFSTNSSIDNSGTITFAGNSGTYDLTNLVAFTNNSGGVLNLEFTAAVLDFSRTAFVNDGEVEVYGAGATFGAFENSADGIVSLNANTTFTALDHQGIIIIYDGATATVDLSVSEDTDVYKNSLYILYGTAALTFGTSPVAGANNVYSIIKMDEASKVNNYTTETFSNLDQGDAIAGSGYIWMGSGVESSWIIISDAQSITLYAGQTLSDNYVIKSTGSLTITIEGTATVMSSISVNGELVINGTGSSGSVIMTGAITVEEGGSFTIGENLENVTFADVTNNGTVTINGTNNTFADVINNGTLTINGANNTFANVTNNSTLTINGANNTFAYAANNGTLTINGANNTFSSLYNYSELNINATLGSGSVTNYGNANIGSGVTLGAEFVSLTNSTITVLGTDVTINGMTNSGQLIVGTADVVGSVTIESMQESSAASIIVRSGSSLNIAQSSIDSTVLNEGAIFASTNVTFNNGVTVNNGSFSGNNTTITFTNDTAGAGATSDGSVTLWFTSDSEQTVFAGELTNVGLSGGTKVISSAVTITNINDSSNNAIKIEDGGTLTLNGANTINSAVTVSTGGTLNLAATDISFAKTLANAGTINIQANSFVLDFDLINDGTLSIAGNNFTGSFTNNGTINVSGTNATITGTMNSGKLNVLENGSATFNTTANEYFGYSIATGGTLTFTTTDVYGNIDNAGTIIADSDLTFYGSTSGDGKIISTGTTVTYNDNALSVFTGEYVNLVLGNGDYTLVGDATISGTATQTSGTFTATNGTVTYNASGDQELLAGSYDNITLSNGGTKSVAGDMTISGDAYSDANTSFVAAAGTTITYNGSGSQHVMAGTYANLVLVGQGTKYIATNDTLEVTDSFKAYGSSASSLITLTSDSASSNWVLDATNVYLNCAKLSYSTSLNDITIINETVVYVSGYTSGNGWYIYNNSGVAGDAFPSMLNKNFTSISTVLDNISMNRSSLLDESSTSIGNLDITDSYFSDLGDELGRGVDYLQLETMKKLKELKGLELDDDEYATQIQNAYALTDDIDAALNELLAI